MSIAEKITRLNAAKNDIATAITNKGVIVAETDGFEEFADKIESISGGGGTAVPSDVVAGKTFSSDAGTELVGTMASYTDEEIKVIDPIPEVVEELDKFVTIGDSRFFWSLNGINWSSRITGNPTNSEDVAYGDGKFVAVGRDGTSYYLPNGTNYWTKTSGLPTDRSFYTIAYGNGKFVTADNYGYLYYSLDGITWISGGTLTFVSERYNQTLYCERIIYANNKFIATGQSGYIVTSEDGLSWSQSGGATGTGDSIVYGDGVFLAFFNNKGTFYIYKSSDNAESWTSTRISFFVNTIAYGSGKFIAFGNGEAYYSIDGINWTSIADLVDAGYFESATYANNKFVMVGGGSNDHYGYVLTAYSLDGITWVVSNTGYSGRLSSVTSHVEYPTYLTYTIPEGYHSSQKIMLKSL